MRQLITLLLASLLASCANPLNEATASRYSAQCGAAESAGNLALAEEACYRAVKNADWGNLSPELKSQHLYNFARIERRLAKFNEAEKLLKESLAIEEPLSGPSGVKVGRRLVELSVNLAAQKKWSEGETAIMRVIPIAPGFSASERSYTREVYLSYAATLQELGRVSESNVLKAAAATLQ
jgi:tetratricopeptide (TPR) repeat protein